MSDHWLEQASAWNRQGIDFVLVTVMSVRGSAPCEVGRRMLVAKDSLSGTIGGGRLEQEVAEQARSMLEGRQPDNPSVGALSLGSRLGQCCGGKVLVHYETIKASLPVIALFGAGHVGQELSRILMRLPNRLIVVDPRLDWLERLPKDSALEIVHETEPVDAVADLPSGSACVVLTHRHDLDLAICSALLKRADMRMVGVIGSKTKALRFRRELEARGLDSDQLTCPVGTQSGKHPAAVAIGMAAKICEQLATISYGSNEPNKQVQRLLEQLVQSAE